MSGVFRVVATPIGNLEDLSSRARTTLCESDFVLAEDTRRARILLEHIQSKARVLSCHQHNELSRVSWAKDALAENKSIALVSDAGAPSISDPGGRLVAELAEAAYRVEVIPGPSAPVAALMGAGIAATRFVFLGFLPRKNGARKSLLERVAPDFGMVLFESPHRVESTLDALYATLGARRVVVARELTKRFETFHRGVLGKPLQPPLVARGEIVIVVESGDAQSPGQGPTPDRDEMLRKVMAEEGMKPRERAKWLAKELQISTRDAYALVQNHESSVSAAGSERQLSGDGHIPGQAANESSARAYPSFSESLSRIRNRISESASSLDEAKVAMWRAACALADAEHFAADAARAEGDDVPCHLDEEDGNLPVPAAPLEESIEVLRALLDAKTALPAPVEFRECVTTLLRSCLAMDALEEALNLVSEPTPLPTRGDS